MSRMDGYEKYKYDGYTVFGRISGEDEIDHAVEDARTRPRAIEENGEKQKPKKSREKARTKRTSGFLIACITILCFAFTAFAADLFSGNASLATYASLLLGKKQKENFETYYLVYATHAEDMGVSYKNASVIQKEGGAGYVMKIGKEYYVILNAYAKKEDAEKVAKKQATFGVYELKLYSFDPEKAKDLKGAAINASLYKKVVETLYDQAIGTQEKIYSASDVKAALLPIKEEIAVAEETFSRTATNGGANAVLDYKVLLRTMKSSIENIIQSESDLLPLLRYYSVSILHSEALFREKYFS